MSWITNLLSGRKTVAAPEPVRQVYEPKRLYELLLRQFSGKFHGGEATIRHSDRGFVTLTPDEALGCLKRAWAPYQDQVYDCDDMAFAAKNEACLLGRKLGKPAAFGIIWTTADEDHAFNWYVHQGKVVLLDVEVGGERTLKGEITLLLC